MAASVGSKRSHSVSSEEQSATSDSGKKIGTDGEDDFTDSKSEVSKEEEVKDEPPYPTQPVTPAGSATPEAAEPPKKKAALAKDGSHQAHGSSALANGSSPARPRLLVNITLGSHRLEALAKM
jgi:hypothetical protein